MPDFSWLIALVLGLALLTAFGLMLFDWRHETLKEDLRNAGIAAIGCTVSFIALNALHVRHADWIFGPLASMVGALFSKEERNKKAGLHVTVLVCSIGGMALQNAIDIAHLQRYQWPIFIAAIAAVAFVAWSYRKSRDGVEPFGPKSAS